MEEEGTVRKWRITLCVLAVAVATVFTATAYAQQPAQQLMTNVKVGDRAPDFTLPDHTGKQVKLSDFKGKKNVVLAFYVLAFTAG
jgi:cytochrome oxidase Cu insertion factor (SCO1/SenC/PrrC family)